MARKGTNRRSMKRIKRRSMKVKGGKSVKRNNKTVKRLKKRVSHRGGNGKSAYHHTIAMVGDATTQKNNFFTSGYN